jgi:hypothetical protein
MKNYDLIGAVGGQNSLEFDERLVAKLTVQQLHLVIAKLLVIRDQSRSARRREKLLNATDALQGLIHEFQLGVLDDSIRNADRSTLLFADVEMARDTVKLVVAESSDPNKAFWLVGGGGPGIDVSDVVK